MQRTAASRNYPRHGETNSGMGKRTAARGNEQYGETKDSVGKRTATWGNDSQPCISYIYDAMNAGTRWTPENPTESKTVAKALHDQQFRINVYLVVIRQQPRRGQ